MITPKEALEQIAVLGQRAYCDGSPAIRMGEIATEALASFEGEAVGRVARIIDPGVVIDGVEYQAPERRDARTAKARAILAAGLVADEAAISQSALWVISYTNHRGETSVRRIIPKSVRFGSTEWHPEPQWLLLAWDADKQADREFALKDFGSPEAAIRADERKRLLGAVTDKLRDDTSERYAKGWNNALIAVCAAIRSGGGE